MESHKENEINGPHSMGTTIIGVTYNGGVVLGADSRTSTGKNHNFLLLQKT
jgi:20S proteasome subunit beta 1